jgi:hypothetical protein
MFQLHARVVGGVTAKCASVLLGIAMTAVVDRVCIAAMRLTLTIPTTG